MSLQLTRQEGTERLYIYGGCPNPQLMEGTAPDSLRRLCAVCPDVYQAEGRKLGRASVTDELYTPTPKEKPMPSTLTLPTNVTPPGAPPQQPAPVPPQPQPPTPVPPQVVMTQGLPLPTNVLPPGTPVVASPAHPADAGLVPGVVVGPATPGGQVLVQWAGTAAPVLEQAAHIQIDQATPQQPMQPPQQMPQMQPPMQPQMPLQQLPSQSEGFLPGMNLEGVGDESTIDVDEILENAGCVGGPSQGGISWHTLEPSEACWRRAYFELVLGLRKRTYSPALSLGSLVHACFELHYKSGGVRTFEPCDRVAAAGAVSMAADAKRFVYAQLEKYGAEEAQTWDVRAVEAQGTWFMPPEKINGRTIHIPLTCRYDLVVALRQPGGPCHMPGQPVPHGCSIVDFKTAKALSYDLTKGYSMDGQFLMNALIYRSTDAALFGPLNGVIVSIIAKHKKMSKDSLFRVHTSADEGSVSEFYHEEVRPQAIELYRRLASPEMRADMHRWPKCHSSCVGPYGPCFFFDICDTPPGGEDAVMACLYKVVPSRIKDVTNFIEPPIEHKRTVGKTPEQIAAEESARAATKDVRSGTKQLVVDAFVRGVFSYPQFQAKSYLRDGVKPKDARLALAASLQEAWTVGTRFDLQLTADPNDKVSMTITSKGVSWTAREKRGSWTFKSFAVEISHDWWNPATQGTASVEEDSDSAQPVHTGPMAAPQPPQQ
jgi:hypothetical protein